MCCPTHRISRSAGAKGFSGYWFYRHFVPPGLKTVATGSIHLLRGL